MFMIHKVVHKPATSARKEDNGPHPAHRSGPRERTRELSHVLVHRATGTRASRRASPRTIPVSPGTVCPEHTVDQECARWVHRCRPFEENNVSFIVKIYKYITLKFIQSAIKSFI